MQNATAWLTSEHDYNEGLEILRSAGISTFMLEILESGPDNYNTPQLLEEITAIAKKETAILKTPEIVYTEDAPEPSATEQSKNLEKKLRTDGKIRETLKEMAHLHGQLSALPEGDRLYECARLLITKNLQKSRMWDELHYYKNNGQWFDELPENQPKPENLQQEIKNLMSNRSKAKAKLKDPLPTSKRNFYEAKVADLTKRIETLNEQFNVKS